MIPNISLTCHLKNSLQRFELFWQATLLRCKFSNENLLKLEICSATTRKDYGQLNAKLLRTHVRYVKMVQSTNTCSVSVKIQKGLVLPGKQLDLWFLHVRESMVWRITVPSTNGPQKHLIPMTAEGVRASEPSPDHIPATKGETLRPEPMCNWFDEKPPSSFKANHLWSTCK